MVRQPYQGSECIKLESDSATQWSASGVDDVAGLIAPSIDPHPALRIENNLARLNERLVVRTEDKITALIIGIAQFCYLQIPASSEASPGECATGRYGGYVLNNGVFFVDLCILIAICEGDQAIFPIAFATDTVRAAGAQSYRGFAGDGGVPGIVNGAD